MTAEPGCDVDTAVGEDVPRSAIVRAAWGEHDAEHRRTD